MLKNFCLLRIYRGARQCRDRGDSECFSRKSPDAFKTRPTNLLTQFASDRVSDRKSSEARNSICSWDDARTRGRNWPERKIFRLFIASWFHDSEQLSNFSLFLRTMLCCCSRSRSFDELRDFVMQKNVSLASLMLHNCAYHKQIVVCVIWARVASRTLMMLGARRLCSPPSLSLLRRAESCAIISRKSS